MANELHAIIHFINKSQEYSEHVILKISKVGNSIYSSSLHWMPNLLSMVSTTKFSRIMIEPKGLATGGASQIIPILLNDKFCNLSLTGEDKTPVARSA